jgi:hypothetical protein
MSETLAACPGSPNSLLAHTDFDYRTFVDISNAWSQSASREPSVMVEGLLQAFLRGHFERGRKSVVFLLDKPGGPDYRRGEGEVVLKVGPDRSENATDERELCFLQRTAVAGILRGCCGFCWDGSEQGVSALATYPITNYTSHFLTSWPPIWCLQRQDFERFYGGSRLSVGTPLESFWPDHSSVTRGVMSSPEGSADSGVRAPKLSPQECKIDEHPLHARDGEEPAAAAEK